MWMIWMQLPRGRGGVIEGVGYGVFDALTVKEFDIWAEEQTRNSNRSRIAAES